MAQCYQLDKSKCTDTEYDRLGGAKEYTVIQNVWKPKIIRSEKWLMVWKFLFCAFSDFQCTHQTIGQTIWDLLVRYRPIAFVWEFRFGLKNLLMAISIMLTQYNTISTQRTTLHDTTFTVNARIAETIKVWQICFDSSLWKLFDKAVSQPYRTGWAKLNLECR